MKTVDCPRGKDSTNKFDKANNHEQGSRDWRMLPVALCVWVAALGSHAMFTLLTGQQNNLASAGQGRNNSIGFSNIESLFSRITNRLAGGLSIETLSQTAGLVLLLAGLIVLVVSSQRWFGEKRKNENLDQVPANSKLSGMLHGFHDYRKTWAVVLVSSALAAFIASMSADVMADRDPAMALVREGESTVEASVRLDSPITAASSWQADCQANAHLVNIGHDGISQASKSRIVLYANKPLCGRLSDGQTIETSGTLETARYGMRPIWLTISDDAKTSLLERAPPTKRLVDSMQRSFFSVTEGLSDQGRVLVPGLTIGLLGQDFMGAMTDKREPINATFATLLEMHFKDSGIMHLMAVSGGHFALIGSLIRSGCARFLLPRQMVAVLTVLAYVALASAMYPSDSVMRALIMGIFASSAMFAGRRSQAISALSWTAILVLLVNPAMSRSYGFALSCASVLGIVLCAGPIAERLSALLPQFFADGMSVTIAAQLFTLPIQVLMNPTLPLLSVPANLVVAPFVDFSTLTGLAGLVLSSWAPHLSFVFVWLSSCGTSVMQWCADTIGGSQTATMPWAGGVGGALMIVACEIGMVLPFKALSRMRRKRDEISPVAGNDSYLKQIRSKGTIWLKETEQMFEKLGKPD
ncbi:ComEC/Rec2 family competence protein [Bifidobacterium sp. ESL0732]|uniref:ComEC/Rec2 family competence protein n=1 Tax=Bifidobacterium sp. ESL0732 TaxID=2983222 RepID=UPI0023F6A992|nr:ComEC/Rec2 family competence protein [Bifidobacterium sp. ESL0732]WEV63317.1 ComEC/Rec2 family competence protein [Bifidobacterium sp. ESL0732]